MHNASWWRNNGRRWPRTDLREGAEETKSGTAEEDKNDSRRKGTKEDNTGFFGVIFKRCGSHRKSGGWVTEWLFYYVADWPQPSNTWACTCGSLLQALIISVLLVTFSFSHSSSSPQKIRFTLTRRCLVFLHTKTCLCFTGNKERRNLTRCLSNVSFWWRFIWFYY